MDRLVVIHAAALVFGLMFSVWAEAQSATGSEVSAISKIQVLPGHEAEVMRAIDQVKAATLADPGCSYFFFTTKQDDSSTILLFEEFRSDADFQQHVRATSTAQFLELLRGKVEGDRPMVTLLRQNAGPVTATASTSSNLERENEMERSVSRGIDHVGVTVPDVNAASAFLERAVGARTVYDVLPDGSTPMAGPETEKELGMPAGAKIVHMRLMQIGTGPTLELFQIEAAPHQNASRLNDFGWTHVALYVDDIEAAAKRFEEAGGTLLSPPHALAGIESGERNRGVYGRAPWGGLIELISYPSGIQYPHPGNRRWTPPPQR